LLSDLVTDRVVAIVVPSFASELACDQIEAALDRARPEPYYHEVGSDSRKTYEYYGVDRIGMPFNLTYEGERQRQRYYDERLAGTRRFRELVTGPSPIDRLRLELDEVWPDGAMLGAFEGIKMFAGIVRLMNAERSRASEETPHIDVLPGSVCELQDQWAANVYIHVPDGGGELEVWDLPKAQSTADYPSDKLSRESLPEPDLVTPRRGDLILFSARKPHAIRHFPLGRRISMQCFIGYFPGRALVLWN
jgi:hypothetical protein